MNLQDKYFDYIKNGTKRIELRLNDEKRRNIKIGDIIEFSKGEFKSDFIKCKVIGLIYYSDFSSLIDDFDISILCDKSMSKDDLIKDLESFYTSDMQRHHGVVGIRFCLI